MMGLNSSGGKLKLFNINMVSMVSPYLHLTVSSLYIGLYKISTLQFKFLVYRETEHELPENTLV